MPRWLAQLAPGDAQVAAWSELQLRVRLPLPPAGWGPRWTLAAEQSRYRWFALHVLPPLDTVRGIPSEYVRWRTTLRALFGLVASRPASVWSAASRRYLAHVVRTVFRLTVPQTMPTPSEVSATLLDVYGRAGVRTLLGASATSRLLRALTEAS